MTQLLIRLFIRRPNSPQDPRVRAAYGNLASVVGMVCNILLCLGKFVVGTLFGSIAITADALNNLSDASSNIVSLVGFKLAAKAPDAEHPYGHARFEYLAGLVVSVTILGIGFSLLKESVTKVLHPTPVQFGWLTVAVLVVSILVKLWMSGFNRTIGRIISSETLIATAADSRNDRQRSQQRRDLESGVLAAAPDLLLGLLQRRPGRLLGRGLKAVVHLFIVIFHGSALLFGVSVQKSGSGRSSIWLTRFNDSLRRIYGWKRKLISTKSGALPTSPIVVLHPACRMAARQAS